MSVTSAQSLISKFVYWLRSPMNSELNKAVLRAPLHGTLTRPKSLSSNCSTVPGTGNQNTTYSTAKSVGDVVSASPCSLRIILHRLLG